MTIAESKPKGKLYRIMDFARVVQIFESKSLYFASHLTSWEDPYTRSRRHLRVMLVPVRHLGRDVAHLLPHGLGVRISTTKAKLAAAAKQWTDANDYGWKGREVEYESQRRLNQRLYEITGHASVHSNSDYNGQVTTRQTSPRVCDATGAIV